MDIYFLYQYITKILPQPLIWLGHSQQYAASNVPTSKHYFYHLISLQTGGLEAGGAGEEKEVQSPERREGGGEVCHQGEGGDGKLFMTKFSVLQFGEGLLKRILYLSAKQTCRS